MKEKDHILTLQETEQLCHQYMDCRLSVLEETELRYFLTQVDYHSVLIDEVREIMNIDTYFADKNIIEAGKKLSPKWVRYMSMAASIAVVICISLFFIKTSSSESVEPQSYYIAYVDGHLLSDEEAQLQVEEAKKSADDFIKKMEELEAHEQEMIDDFFYENNLEV